ncbi:hypothetical protein [Nocardiopsis synnemataformans]|uniref:hypothetical protein n=1 Tax=Nocardiopsis synnemataformans TaxID=61305 RepID=UPI003EC14FAD
MPTRDVRITGLTPGYEDLAVAIGGTQVSRSLYGLALTAREGEEPRLTLDVVIVDRSTIEGQMDVDIPDQTRATLIALGWTPPTKEPSTHG